MVASVRASMERVRDARRLSVRSCDSSSSSSSSACTTAPIVCCTSSACGGAMRREALQWLHRYPVASFGTFTFNWWQEPHVTEEFLHWEHTYAVICKAEEAPRLLRYVGLLPMMHQVNTHRVLCASAIKFQLEEQKPGKDLE
eukprot:1193458-Prorocentrum_minimum.AAC.2